jgi:starch-binding outer membrane protein, SusD/RagB family
MRTMIKNRLRATLLLSGLLATGACKDLTEVPSDFVSPEIFYQNQADALAAVNAAYASFINLPSPLSNDFYLGRNFWMLVEYPTEYATSRLSATNERSLIGTFHTQFNATHAYLEGYWKAAYAGINRANTVIARVPAIDNMDATRRDRVVAEAKFLRALHYYWLAGMFGGVPLKLDETQSISGDGLPRATIEETYAQIEKDLTEAAAVLPPSWPLTDFGRATRGAALTLLGKAYLQSAGQFGITANYAKAVTTLRQAQALPYTLVSGPQYRTLFDGSNERAGEIIFSLQNVRVDGLGGQMTEWFTPIVDPVVTSAGQQNQFQAERPFYDSYPATDVRKDGTWLTSFVTAGRTVTWAWTSGIQTAANYGSTGPAVRKYIDWGAPDDGSEAPDYVILRYADVLLSLAEAINATAGPTAEAYALVDQVRTRAGIPALTPGLTQPQFRDAVFLERKYEFAMELHGVFDMRRNWDWAKARVEANMRLARPTSAGGANINASPFTSSVEKCSVSPSSVCFNPIADKWKLYPIPAHAIELNALLTQNPGW